MLPCREGRECATKRKKKKKAGNDACRGGEKEKVVCDDVDCKTRVGSERTIMCFTALALAQRGRQGNGATRGHVTCLVAQASKFSDLLG